MVLGVAEIGSALEADPLAQPRGRSSRDSPNDPRGVGLRDLGPSPGVCKVESRKVAIRAGDAGGARYTRHFCAVIDTTDALVKRTSITGAKGGKQVIGYIRAVFFVNALRVLAWLDRWTRQLKSAQTSEVGELPGGPLEDVFRQAS